jgi:hypothetical protein
MYGGDTTSAGTAIRQEFPVDAFSRELFERQNAPASMENTWAMEIQPKRLFAYELTRPGRRFRVEFDLSAPVPAPPAPWALTRDSGLGARDSGPGARDSGLGARDSGPGRRDP